MPLGTSYDSIMAIIDNLLLQCFLLLLLLYPCDLPSLTNITMLQMSVLSPVSMN